MDIHTACFQYCTSKAIRPSKIKSYKNVVRTFVSNTGITELEQITLELLTEWKNDVVKRSSAATFNNYYRHLSALFNFCVKKKLLAENPLADVLKFTRVSSRGKPPICLISRRSVACAGKTSTSSGTRFCCAGSTSRTHGSGRFLWIRDSRNP